VLNGQIGTCLLGTRWERVVSAVYTDLRATMHSAVDGRTDGRRDDANSRSHCVRSAKKKTTHFGNFVTRPTHNNEIPVTVQFVFCNVCPLVCPLVLTVYESGCMGTLYRLSFMPRPRCRRLWFWPTTVWTIAHEYDTAKHTCATQVQMQL